VKVTLLHITANATELIEDAGRTAWASSGRKSEGSDSVFIGRLIHLGHLSVLEHATATFRIEDISRACSHQVVRHRLCSCTQRSQRYVNEQSFEYVMPASIASHLTACTSFTRAMNYARMMYRELRRMGIPKEDARFVLPNATRTEIVITANLRQWRHMIELRTSKHAQWEIREVMMAVLRILKDEVPAVFLDFGIV